jgi:hypothetical protein
MGQSKGSIELTLTGGQILVMDREDYDRLPWKDKWRIYSGNGKRVFVGRPSGPKVAIKYLSSIIFSYDRWRQKISFKNGNPLDYRSSNVEFLCREGNRSQKNCENYIKRRMDDPIKMNGCVLIRAKSGKRCAEYLKCNHYEKCLDAVALERDWPGWNSTKS